MKICIVLPHFYPYVGGGEKMFYDLAKELVQRGHKVRVIARNVGEEYLGHKVVDEIEVWYCPWKSHFGHPIPRISDIEEHIKWCDVVHTSIFTTAAPVSRLAKKYHKPSILTVYEVRGTKWFWVENFVKACAFYAYEQYVCRQRFDIYHSISEATKKDYLKFCGKKEVCTVYLANEMNPELGKHAAINLHEYFEVEKNMRLFLFYGRPGQTKGIDIYEKAIKRLKNQGIDLSRVKFCFILGAEPVELRAKFVKLIHEEQLDDVVLIKESLPREELSGCILQADYVVVPSVTEGFGFSALEACQMGKHIIYSDGGSLPEVVYGKCLGFENRNDTDLADKLQRIVQKGDEAFDNIGEKKFTYDRMINGIIRLYEKALYNRGQ